MGLTPQPWTPDHYRTNLVGPLGAVTSAMERTGCVVDIARLKDIAGRARGQQAVIETDLRAWAGRDVNFNSWQQLGAFLHTDETGLRLEPSPYWKKGAVDVDEGEIKTDDRALEYLAAANPDHRAQITSIRELRKLTRAANYAEDWIDKALVHSDGTRRLYPSFGLGSDHDNRPGAKTGRFAVKNPPLNQVPKAGEGPIGDLRSAFVPPPGYRMIVVDYSQLEIVLLAHLIVKLFGPDDTLVQKVRRKEDIHGPFARYAFGELAGDPDVAAAPVHAFKEVPRLKVLRNLAKSGIYGNNYGKTETGFATSLYLPSGEPLGAQRARLLVEGMRKFYPGIIRYQGFIRDWITAHGSISTLFGRLMWLPLARAQRQGDRNKAWRQALNYPLQGGGQEIMALALLLIQSDPRLKEFGFTLSLVVHDEIVGFAPESTAEQALACIAEDMTTAVELEAPLLVEGHTGDTWSDAK